MKKRDYRAELGVRFVERHVHTDTFNGRRNVVETVDEYSGSWEGEKRTYRYAIHWLYDYETLKCKWYDKLPANDEAAMYGKISIPAELWRKMEGEAFKFLNTEEVKDSISSTIIIKQDPEVPCRLVVTFKDRRYSGFTLVYKIRTGGVLELFESTIRRPKLDEAARRGHSRIPKLLCETAHSLVYEFIQGHPHSNIRQQALKLEDSDACG